MRDRSTSVKPSAAEFPPGTNVLFDVWLVSRATTGLLDEALSPAGLTADEFGVYSVLTGEGTLTPSDLARWMSAPLTTVSSYLKRFEARGHVQRARHPHDGRSFVISLTPAGRDAHRLAAEHFSPVLDRVVAALGREEAAVRRTLRSLQQVLVSDGSDEPRST